MKTDIDIVPDRILKAHGLEKGGRVQKFVDSESIRLMSPYTPYLHGDLEKSVVIGTVIGSGILSYNSPYARFQYYGKVMIDPKTGSTWAPLHGKKVVTDRELEYQTSRHPLAGKKWFDRMKEDKSEQILRGCKKLI